MIRVTFDPPVNGVAVEVIVGLAADGQEAQTSLEAVDVRIEQYNDQGELVATGSASQGMQSLIVALRQ